MFNKPGVFPGLEDVVSAHIQLPVYTSMLLSKHEIENIVISTVVPDNQVLPNLFREINPDIVSLVPDPNKQGGRSVVIDGHIKGVENHKLLKHVVSVVKVLKREGVKVLHVFGTERYALFSILFRFLLPRLKIVWTTENFSDDTSWLQRQLIKKCINRVLTTTSFVKSKYAYCPDVRLASRGIVRQFELKRDAQKRRVLFWRDPSRENGADIAFDVFKNLSNKYPEIIFTFAVRPHWDSVVSPEDCVDFDNIEMHVFPYDDGVTIEKLLSESICVIFPFRELSTNPQLALIETLYAEIPVICSNVESNEEILDRVGMNYELTDNADDYAKKLSTILDDYLQKDEIHRPLKRQMDEFYNWDSYVNACIDSYR